MKRTHLQILVSSIIGLLFIGSSILKFKSLEVFEIYLFSSGWFSFAIISFLARLLIIGEFILGGLILFRAFYRVAWYIALTILGIFSVFLIWQIGEGNTDNCHCFGELFPLSPLLSLVKNILLILCLGLIYKAPLYLTIYRFNRYIFLSFISLGIIFTFSVNPPDFSQVVFYGNSAQYSPKEYYNHFPPSTTHPQSKNIKLFASTNCKYCLLAIKKLDLMISPFNIKKDVEVVFFGDTVSINGFFNQANIHPYPYRTISVDGFISITKGRIPAYFFLRNDSIVKVLDYSSITEKEIADFLE